MSKHLYSFISIMTIFLNNTVFSKFCGEIMDFQTPNGKIETTLEIEPQFKNCMWTVETPEKSVIFFRIVYLQLGSTYRDSDDKEESNCLRITSREQTIEYLKICNDVSYLETFSIFTNKLLVHLEITSVSFVRLDYASYLVHCSHDQLICQRTRYYSRSSEGLICPGGMLACGYRCRYGRVICGNLCYDMHKERCDGVVDCLKAEDEIGCHPYECPNKIRCPTEPKCITSREICDDKTDCRDSFDEANCHNFACKKNESNCMIGRSTEFRNEMADNSFIILIVFGIMLVLFIFLICKCIASRDNLRNVLDHRLDVPLPPFRGPGEAATTADDTLFTNEDFRPGGEIFENFSANLKRIKERRQEKEDDNPITYVGPPEGHEDILYKYFKGVKPVLSEDMAALATLKISRNKCKGLRKTKSEEKPMTRLLFIDNKDDESDDSNEYSDDADAEEETLKKTCHKHAERPCKSDTDCVKKRASSQKVH